MGYPERLLTDGEHIVREFRPHWRLLVIPVVWALVGIAAIVVTWRLAPDEAVVDWIITALAVLFIVVMAVYPFVTWWFTQYVLTNERLITRSGILARRGLEIPLENVNDVQFSQNILERVLRSGDLLIESAGEQGQSLFRDIPDPEEFQSLLYRIRESRSRDLQGTGDQTSDPTVKLERLAALYRDGMLTQEEYETKKQALLDEI